MHAEVSALADVLARAKPLFDQDHDKLHQFLTAQAAGRGLSAIIIFTPDGRIVDRADVQIATQPELPKAEALAKVTETEAQISLIPEGVDAIIKLHGYDNTYLYVARAARSASHAAIECDPGKHCQIRQSGSP